MIRALRLLYATWRLGRALGEMAETLEEVEELGIEHSADCWRTTPSDDPDWDCPKCRVLVPRGERVDAASGAFVRLWRSR